MYQIFEVTSDVDGKQRRENVLISWRDGNNLAYVLHKLGLEYALSPEGLRKCRNNGVSYSEILTRLTPEMLAPYDMRIIWLDRDSVCVDNMQLISRYELESYMEAMERDIKREAKMREVDERYARRLERLKADGHPLISTWDAGRVSARAISWAYQYVRAGESDAKGFFDKKLADAVCRAGQSPQDAGGADEQENIPKTA